MQRYLGFSLFPYPLHVTLFKKKIRKKKIWPDGGSACLNLSPQEVGGSQFEASIIYRASFRTDTAMQRNCLNKTKQPPPKKRYFRGWQEDSVVEFNLWNPCKSQMRDPTPQNCALTSMYASWHMRTNIHTFMNTNRRLNNYLKNI